MEPILPVMVSLLAIGAIAAFLLARGKTIAAGSPEKFLGGERWTGVRDQLGQDFLARLDDGSIRLEKVRGRESAGGLRIVVSDLRQGPGALRMCRERHAGNKHGEIETGDEDFDRAVSVKGSVPLARALLDAEARRVLGRLFGGKLVLEDGSVVPARAWITGYDLRIEIPRWVLEASKGSAERLARAIEAAARLAGRLEAPGDIPGRIALNIGREPHPRVRLQDLLTLIREFPGDPATRRALLLARDDGSDEVRLRAAVALGEEGTDILLDLASGEGSSDACAARAIAELGGRLPADRCSGILEATIPAGRARTAIACMGSLSGRGEAAVEPLGRALLGRFDAPRVPFALLTRMRVAAARALGETGAPPAEGPLVSALRRPAMEVRIAAAEALGKVGSAGAVPFLREAEGRSPEEALQRAARQAVASIQARLSGAEHGQLSLAGAGEEAGKLSLAEAGRSGELSFPAGDAPLRPPATDMAEAPGEEGPAPPSSRKLGPQAEG